MGSEARARLGLVALLFVTLFSFSQLFGEGDYSGPSLLAMAFAMGISVGMRRLGAGASTTLFVSATGLLCYLSWIFEGRNSWFLIPTPASIRGLIDSVGAALDKASVDFAPIPVRPGYVILIAAGMWILTTIGEVGTFRWRRPLVASIGAVGMFAFVMVVGSRTGAWVLVVLFLIALFTYWSLEAAHRLRSWGSWVAAWGEENDEPPVLTHSAARRMGASSILIALVVPLFLPAIGSAVVSWKSGIGDGAGTGGGGGGGGSVDPLVSIAPQIINQSDTELFRVRTENLTRWRLNTLEEIDGDVWKPSDGELNDFVTPPPEVHGLPARERSAEFTITGLEGEALPTRYPTATLEFVEGGEQEDLRVSSTNKDISIAGGVEQGLTYIVRALEPDVSFQDLADADATASPAFLNLTALPSGDPLHPDIVALRDSWTEGADNDFEQLVAIQDRLRGPEFIYDLDVQTAEEIAQPPEGHLYNFLLETRTGYCQQFATSFALLSRSLGFPTRIAVGFLPGESIEGEDNRFLVKGEDAHAWPEVFFKGAGWIAFEPTPRTDRFAAAPGYTSNLPQSPDGQLGGAFPPSDSAPIEDPNTRATGDPRRGREDIVPDIRFDGELAGDEAVGDAWKKPFTRLVFIALGAVILFLIAVPTLKASRVKRRYRRATTPAGRAAAAFAEFELEAAELAARRRRSESAPSYARRVSEMSRLDEQPAIRLAWIYERAEYGGDEINPGVADEARRIARSLRASLWSNAGWWQRALRLFSPAGLRSGV